MKPCTAAVQCTQPSVMSKISKSVLGFLSISFFSLGDPDQVVPVVLYTVHFHSSRWSQQRSARHSLLRKFRQRESVSHYFASASVRISALSFADFANMRVLRAHYFASVSDFRSPLHQLRSVQPIGYNFCLFLKRFRSDFASRSTNNSILLETRPELSQYSIL